MLRAASMALLVFGVCITAYSTLRYRALFRYNRQETYRALAGTPWVETLSLFFLYLFTFGFVAALGQVILKDVDSVYVVVLVFLCLGALFIFFSVNAQVAMAVKLRLKTMELMRTVVNAIDMKDAYTKGHSEHVQKLVALLYDHLDEAVRARIDKHRLLDAALLHDCGKISVRDGVLNKPGHLTVEEWADMKSHPLTGKKMLDDTCFSDISDWVLYHHERMDGKGYFGLEGDDIPLESRMISIADSYSALTTNRIYRPRLSHDEALEIMSAAAGSQFDPFLMGCFLKINRRSLERVLP
ncbi:MAG: HD-GYP domain-containing protein [Deltaproteobacteria bacterium]|nr:HD-GYP domain-containing protein [Deltaproteobacteria bacterium]